MNYSEYSNRRIYHEWGFGKTLALGEKRGQFDKATTVDLEGSDFITNLEYLPNYRHLSGGPYDTIRCCEILEHLTQDAYVLKSLHDISHTETKLIVTVPYHGIADYHVRLHNKWSITKLLSVTGWRVISYIPRKAQRIDKIIWMLRVFGQWVNPLFFAINKFLPWKPNGGYFLCVQDKPFDLHKINLEEFRKK